MNLTKIIFAASVIASTIGGAMASTASLLHQSHSVSGSPIITITVVTPGNKEISPTTDTLFVGKSLTKPCSDLASAYELGSKEVAPGDIAITSSDVVLIESILFAMPGSWTCIRQDITFNSKNYTTGNIQLNWNGTQYTDANPSAATVDFSK